jgi:hypothetical protein
VKLLRNLIIESQKLRHASKGLIYLASFLVLSLGYAACSSPVSRAEHLETLLPTPETQAVLEQAGVSTETLALATATLSMSQIPLTEIEPLVTAKGLRFDSWSPSSEWMAYWYRERGEAVPSHLGFVDINTKQVCQHKEVIAQNLESGNVIWQEGGTSVAILNRDGEAFKGVPCETFAQVEFAQVENVTLLDPYTRTEISPDGRYRAESLIREVEGQLIHYITTIIDNATNEIEVDVSWDGSPHLQGSSGWLNNELYLIGPTVDQGVLYVSPPRGRVGNLVTDILGLQPEEGKDVRHVSHNSNEATGEYHILLERWEGPPGLPLLLYHSEFDWVEELAFYSARSFGKASHGSSFSPDGSWLLLGDPVDKENLGELDDYWLRLVDPPSSTPFKIGDGIGFGGMSTQTRKLAFHDQAFIYILSFPNGVFLGRWYASGYNLEARDWWSADGKQLAVIGFPKDSGQEALFVIEP